MEKNTALNRLTALEFTFSTIQADIENVAVQARVAGATWDEIGHRLGLSKQTAHARYNEAVKNERKTRYAAADAAGQFTADEHAKAAQAMEILTSVADAQDAAAASLAQSKILDADVAGESETPSIFSDADVPATEKDGGWKMKNGDPYTPARTPHTIPDPDTTAQPGTGKGPHQCPGCGDTNHKTQHKNLAVFTADCTPTKYDPPKIAALIQETNA